MKTVGFSIEMHRRIFTFLSMLGLTPDDILGRMAPAPMRPAPSLAFSISYGAVSVTVVSLLAYSIWTFHLIPGTAAMYASIAAVYVVLTGVALSRLLVAPGATSRFALLFAVAFVVYALIWCAFWFGLKGKHHADLWGSAVGLAAMAWMLQRGFGHVGNFLALAGVLFAFHTLGYYLGDVLHGLFRGPPGRMLWGAAHGAGFGAGLGYVLFHCQAPLRQRLLARAAAT
ncbi:MAG: hypothetical protein Q7S40_21475 [Opitutaceae bacterium]|nr:hypothetical protein [Opitutaceae bacterium]